MCFELSWKNIFFIFVLNLKQFFFLAKINVFRSNGGIIKIKHHEMPKGVWTISLSISNSTCGNAKITAKKKLCGWKQFFSSSFHEFLKIIFFCSYIAAWKQRASAKARDKLTIWQYIWLEGWRHQTYNEIWQRSDNIKPKAQWWYVTENRKPRPTCVGMAARRKAKRISNSSSRPKTSSWIM